MALLSVGFELLGVRVVAVEAAVRSQPVDELGRIVDLPASSSNRRPGVGELVSSPSLADPETCDRVGERRARNEARSPGCPPPRRGGSGWGRGRRRRRPLAAPGAATPNRRTYASSTAGSPDWRLIRSGPKKRMPACASPRAISDSTRGRPGEDDGLSLLEVLDEPRGLLAWAARSVARGKDDLAGLWSGCEDLLREAAAVARDQASRGINDERWTPVVAGERVALEARVELVELDDPLDARAAPGVQALVLVADAEEQVLGRGDHLDEQFLRRLDVLVLVDEDCRVLDPASGARAPALAGGVGRPEDVVVEVVAVLLASVAS